MGLTSFPSVPIWLACQKTGLGTLFPPEVLWERCEVHDMRILTSCLLAAAPPLLERQELAAQCSRRFRREFTVRFPYPLPWRSFQCLLLELGLTRVSLVCSRTGRLTIASHFRIAPDARMVKVAPFQAWFGETRHRERLAPRPETPSTKRFVTRRNSTFSPENVSLSGDERRASGARFPVSRALGVRDRAAK